MAAQMLFDKEEKKRKKTKKFAGDGCLNGLQQCGAMLSSVDDSAFFLLRRLAECWSTYGASKAGMLRYTRHFLWPLLIR